MIPHGKHHVRQSSVRRARQSVKSYTDCPIGTALMWSLSDRFSKNKNVTVWTDKACHSNRQLHLNHADLVTHHIVTVMNIEALKHLQLNWKCGGQSVFCFWVFNMFLEWIDSVASRDHPLHWTPNFIKLFQKLREEIFGTAPSWATLMKRSRHFGRMSILMETSGWGPTAKLDLRKISSVSSRMINTIAENEIWRWSFIHLAAFI